MTDPVAEARDNAFWAGCMERVAVSRDRDSFMLLYDHFSPRVNAYLLGQGVDGGTAEDLTQDALLALWNKAHLYQPERAAVSTWLFRVARNLWIDRLRKGRGMAYETDEEYVDAIINNTPAPEDPVESDAEKIRAALQSLPRNQQQVVYKSYFEGKSHSEIAEETGMPLGSVKSSLRLALQAFRTRFGEAV